MMDWKICARKIRLLRQPRLGADEWLYQDTKGRWWRTVNVTGWDGGGAYIRRCDADGKLLDGWDATSRASCPELEVMT